MENKLVSPPKSNHHPKLDGGTSKGQCEIKRKMRPGTAVQNCLNTEAIAVLPLGIIAGMLFVMGNAQYFIHKAAHGQGHDILMTTMLNGAAIMDGALLLIAGNESCPQPQTSEHLATVEIMRLQHIIILQNKIDLIQESAAINQHEAIQKFIQYLITHFSEFQLATVGTFIIHESVFFFSGLPSLYFERSGLFSKYKIQKKSNTPSSQDRCVLQLILYHLCVNLPVMIVSYPTFRFMGLKSTLPLPHWYSQLTFQKLSTLNSIFI